MFIYLHVQYNVNKINKYKYFDDVKLFYQIKR